MVDVLLSEGGAVADCVVLGPKDTALLLAVRQRHTDIVLRLIAAHANVNHQNGYGNTALHEVLRVKNFALAEILLRAGSDLHLCNRKGSSALHFMCYDEVPSPACVAFARNLIRQGAAVDVADLKGMTPLLVCCSSGRDDLLQLLIEEGADPTARDLEGNSARDVAVFYQKENIVRRFFSHESPSKRFDFKRDA